LPWEKTTYRSVIRSLHPAACTSYGLRAAGYRPQVSFAAGPEPAVEIACRSCPAVTRNVDPATDRFDTLGPESFDLLRAGLRPLGESDPAAGRHHPVPRHATVARQSRQDPAHEPCLARQARARGHAAIGRNAAPGNAANDRKDCSSAIVTRPGHDACFGRLRRRTPMMPRMMPR
jgi:hypothetical protein